MRDTRFIFIEGLMGAGKSTTAAFVTTQLERNGIAAHLLLEGPTIDDPYHPLRVATDLPHPNAAWRDVTVEGFIARSMAKWHKFACQAQQSAMVTVCDGLLFHGNMTDLLLMDATPAVLRHYVEGVIATIHALQPVAIYLRDADVAQALRTVRDARGNAWETYQVNWKMASPYAMRRSLQGFQGLVHLFQAYRALCVDIFAQLPLPKLVIHRDGDWMRHYHDILTFLALPSALPNLSQTD